jgi:hypothetical protein
MRSGNTVTTVCAPEYVTAGTYIAANDVISSNH